MKTGPFRNREYASATGGSAHACSHRKSPAPGPRSKSTSCGIEGISCSSSPMESRAPAWLPHGFTRRSGSRVEKGTELAYVGLPEAGVRRPLRRRPPVQFEAGEVDAGFTCGDVHGVLGQMKARPYFRSKFRY